jgi:hypothetical protein
MPGEADGRSMFLLAHTGITTATAWLISHHSTYRENAAEGGSYIVTAYPQPDPENVSNVDFRLIILGGTHPGIQPAVGLGRTFKVYLGGSIKKRPNPPWRKIEIAGSRTLDDLHEAIFDAFDRDDEIHLYAFFWGGGQSKTGLDSYDRIKYTSPEGMTSGRERNSTETAIGSLGLQVGDYLRYLFDFSAEWWHVVELTDKEERADGSLKYPRVVEKCGDPPDPEGWVEYLNSSLVFPFEAEVTEYQDEGRLQIGDRFMVKRVTDQNDKYGVMVEGRVGRRKIEFPLIDLEPVDVWAQGGQHATLDAT